MKTLIVIASLFVISSLQAATISAKALGEIDARIEMQKDALKVKLDHFETDDLTEGKIVAALVNTIEEKLESAEAALDAIQTDDQLTEENVAQINLILDSSEELINEI